MDERQRIIVLKEEAGKMTEFAIVLDDILDDELSLLMFYRFLGKLQL